jgi:hypothetical protein
MYKLTYLSRGLRMEHPKTIQQQNVGMLPMTMAAISA